MTDFERSLSNHPFLEDPYGVDPFTSAEEQEKRHHKIIQDFYRSLEIVILASRHGGSGGRACRDALLSLYNGNVYKANLSNWYNLDNTNFMALILVIKFQTRFNKKDINLYIPEYSADFDRMMEEYLNEQK